MINPTSFSLNLSSIIPGALSYHDARYQKRLKGIPAPGYGHGCHVALLSVATYGLRSGRSKNQILADIKAAIPAGKRRVDDHEIMAAIERASQDTVPAGCNPSMRPSVEIDRRRTMSKTEAAEIKKRVLSYSSGPVKLDCAEFRDAHGFRIEQQPITPLYPEAFTMNQLFSELYYPDDLLYVGPERMQDSGKDNIRPVAEWIETFDNQQKVILERIGNDGRNSSAPDAFIMDLGLKYSHFIPNPVTGCEGNKTTGGLSLRCDGSIRTFKYAILDFDIIKKLEDQGNVLHCLCSAMNIRICALTHTGGRGAHGLVRIDGVETLRDWNKIVRDGLFPTFEALGADPACFNPSRGTRLPGVFRLETGTWQKLLLVNRRGVAI